jgi:prenyltransferase beta subunit
MKRPLLTLVFVGLVAPALWAQTADEKQATIAFLRALQTEAGGFLPAPKAEQPSLRATSSGARALKYFGGEIPQRQAASDFVARCFDSTTGGFADLPGGKPDTTTTAVGLMAVVELKLPTARFADGGVKYLADNARGFEEIRIAAAGLEAVEQRPGRADAWLEEVVKLRNADGTYGKGAGLARATGGSIVAVLRLGGKLDERDHVVKALKAGQRPDGGFGKDEGASSDLETSYRVARAFVMLKEKPDVAKLRGFIARCRNADGGYGVAPGQASTLGGTYFASYILHSFPAD